MRGANFRFVLILALLACVSGEAQGTFQNLGFEAANLPYLPPGQFGDRVSALDALPSWTIYGGYTYPYVLYNTEALDSASISILSATYLYNPPGVIDGWFGVKLRGASFDPTKQVAIGQTGQIPTTAVTLLLDGWYSPVVTFAGVNIPMVATKPLPGGYPNAAIYAGDISVFAGQSGELRFSGFSVFDYIRFSSEPIPEPGGLFFSALVIILWYVRRRTHGCFRPRRGYVSVSYGRPWSWRA